MTYHAKRRVGDHEVYDVPPSVASVTSDTLKFFHHAWRKPNTEFKGSCYVYVPVGALSGANTFAIVEQGGKVEVWPRMDRF